MTDQTLSPTPPPAPGAPTGVAPPPPPGVGPTGPDDDHTDARPRPWRDQLPELVGGIGTVLVLAAVVGFLSATWEDLDRYGRALVLAGAAGGLTAAALVVEGRGRQRLEALTSMLWVAGAGTVAASATLALTELVAGRTRVAIALAGLAGAAHAAAAARRAPGSPLRQLGVVVGLLYAAGPFGTAVGDGYGVTDLAMAFDPVVALVVRSAADDAFALTGALHLAIGAGWLWWSHRSDGLAARVGWVGSTTVLTYAALELHALPTGVGAFGALLVVLGYLVFGLVTERGGLVAVGATGVLIAGSRVLWSLFSGEVATTIASLTVGLALLAWAVRARSGDDAVEV